MTASYNKNTVLTQTNSNETTAEDIEMTIRDIIQQGMELNTLDTSSSNTDDDYTINGRSEISSLQWSVDDMSCQMLKLSKKVNELQTEEEAEVGEVAIHDASSGSQGMLNGTE